MDTLRVKFTHYTKVRDRHPYTVYEIAVQSPSTISWVIYKRYKDFDKLHKSLPKEHPLPTLPPKRMFQIMEATFVETRMAQLQEYMRRLLQLPNLTSHPMLIEFLKVPDPVKPMLFTKASPRSGNSGAALSSVHSGGKHISYPNKSYEDRKVYELVDALQSTTKRVAAIAEFEKFFFERRPRLDVEVVRYLFMGSTDRKTSSGLLGACGNYGYSNVASRAALDLICRFLDVERNKDAHTFIEIFVSLGVQRLRRMQIEHHINEERGSRLGAFRLLALLRERMGARNMEQIIGDSGDGQMARKHFARWAERKRGFTIAPVSNKPPTTRLMENISLPGSKSTKVGNDPFESILQIAKSEGWKYVRRTRVNTEPADNQYSSRKSESTTPTVSDKSPQDQTSTVDSKANADLPTPSESTQSPSSKVNRASSMGSTQSMGNGKDEKKNEEDDSLPKLEYKIVGEIVMVRIRCEIPFPVSKISKLILDYKRRADWDLKFHRGQVAQRLKPNMDIVHDVFKSFSSPYKYRDFCLLRVWTRLQDGTELIAMRSVTHQRVPERKTYIRALLYPTGYIIEPQTSKTAPSEENESKEKADSIEKSNTSMDSKVEDTAMLTFVAQMDRESVLLVSPDLLGESDELLASILNISKCLEADGDAKSQKV